MGEGPPEGRNDASRPKPATTAADDWLGLDPLGSSAPTAPATAQPTATDSKSIGVGGPSSPSYLLDFAVGGAAQVGAGGATVDGPRQSSVAGSLLGGDLSANGGGGGGGTGLTPEMIKLQRENELLQRKVC